MQNMVAVRRKHSVLRTVKYQYEIVSRLILHYVAKYETLYLNAPQFLTLPDFSTAHPHAHPFG